MDALSITGMRSLALSDVYLAKRAYSGLAEIRPEHTDLPSIYSQFMLGLMLCTLFQHAALLSVVVFLA